jgi:hypothetical protein
MGIDFNPVHTMALFTSHDSFASAPNVTDASYVQRPKAQLSMASTDIGIVIDAKPVPKHPFPNCTHLEGASSVTNIREFDLAIGSVIVLVLKLQSDQ